MPVWDGADDFDGPQDFAVACSIAESTNAAVELAEWARGVPEASA